MCIFIGKMLLVLLFFKTISISLIFFLDWIGVFEMPVNLNRTRLESFSKIEILILVSIFAPVLEELTFRLPLKFSKWNLIIAVIGIALILCRVLVELEYEYSLAISTIIGIITYFILHEKILNKLEDLWFKNKLLIFYIFLTVFSFLHLKNYAITTELIMFSPIILLPRILSGLLFSYIRLNASIFIAICFHSFNNGILRVITMFIN